MFSKLKAWLAAAVLGVMATLYALLQIASRQRDAARREAEQARAQAVTTEKRLAQRQAADDASKQAKQEGDARVEEALSRARSGVRDHFTRGLRDD